MVSFKTSKNVDLSFKANKVCKLKKETEIILDDLKTLIENIKKKEDKLVSIREFFGNIDSVHLIAILSILYPNKSFYDAVDFVYEKIKKIAEMVGKEGKIIQKYLNFTGQEEEEIKKIISELNIEIPHSFLIKAVFYKKAIEVLDEECI